MPKPGKEKSICHPEINAVGRGLCALCYQRASRDGTLKNYPRKLPLQSEWATCHPDRKPMARSLCSECYPKFMRNSVPGKREQLAKNSVRWRLENKEKELNTRLLRAHGITLETYTEKLNSQGNVCAICGGEFIPAPHVDHSHTTNKVRGLLCKCCNWGLGHFRDNPEILELAAKYLREYA